MRAPGLVALPLLAFYLAAQEAPTKPITGGVTNFDYSKSRGFPWLLAPYETPYVPNPRLANSKRLDELIVGDTLSLSLDDAIRNDIEMSEAVHGEVRHLPKAP